MLGIKSLLITIVMMASSLHAASPESIQLTENIASKARSNMTRVFGPELHSKIETIINDFEDVAPDIIDSNMLALTKELGSQQNLSPRAQHKLASKYAKKATKEIKAEMKTHSSEDSMDQSSKEVGLSLSKRQVLGAAGKLTKTAVGVMGLVATFFISFIVLSAIVGFFYVTIRRYMYQASYGYGYGYPPYPYMTY